MAKWKELQEEIRDFESQFQNTPFIREVEINGVKRHYDLMTDKEESIKLLSSFYSFLGKSNIVYYNGEKHVLDNKYFFFVNK